MRRPQAAITHTGDIAKHREAWKDESPVLTAIASPTTLWVAFSSTLLVDVR